MPSLTLHGKAPTSGGQPTVAAQEWNEQKFRTLIENSADIFSLLDIQGTVLYKSPSITRVLGFKPEELIGHNAFEWAHPDDRDQLLLLFKTLLAEPDKVLTGEFRHLHKDGSYRWVEGVASNMLTEPAVGAIVFTFRDISQRKRIEQALRERENQLRALTETMPAIPWSASPEGAVDYFSDKWQEWTGLRREQLLGDGWKGVMHPEDLPRMEAAIVQSMKTGEPFDVEHRLRRADGTFRWHRSRALPERDAAGRIVRWHGITDDIHELKTALDAICQNREQLRQNRQRLRLALRSATMGFYERDILTNQAVYDDQCRAILGLPEVVSSPDAAQNLVHPEDRPRVLAAVQRVLDPAIREVASDEFRIIRPDGETRWVAASGRAVFDHGEQPPRPLTLMGVVQDITHRKLAEQQLQQARARLTRSNEELEHTVAERTAKLREAVGELEHMSYSIIHDLRAPLRAMMSYSEILRAESGPVLSARGKEFLQRIMASAARMDLLITDALNYSRAVRNELPLVPVEPLRLLQGMLKSYPAIPATASRDSARGRVSPGAGQRSRPDPVLLQPAEQRGKVCPARQTAARENLGGSQAKSEVRGQEPGARR